MQSGEASLISRAKGGDQEALQEIFRAHRPALAERLRRRIPGHLGRKISAADLIQDTLLAASARLGDFEERGAGSFGRWLDRIADLRLKDQLRRFGRLRRGLDREETRGRRPDTAAFGADDPSPSQVAMAGERREMVRGALAGLPDHYREILLLVQEEQLTLREASERMGRSYEATKKLYGRALGALSEHCRG